jgi:hypothetical protein
LKGKIKMKTCTCGEVIAENENRCGTCLNDFVWQNPNPAPSVSEYPGCNQGIAGNWKSKTWDMPEPLKNNTWDVPAKES